MNIWNVFEDFGTPRDIKVNREKSLVILAYMSFDFCDLFVVCSLETNEFVESYRQRFSIIENKLILQKLDYEDIQDYLE